MDIIYVIMLVFMTGSFCIISFLMGMGRNKKISFNPIEAYKEHKEIKEQERINDLNHRQEATMLRNIERYDGTELGQEDIPME